MNTPPPPIAASAAEDRLKSTLLAIADFMAREREPCDLDRLAAFTAASFGVDYVHVGLLQPGGNVRVLAAHLDGKPLPPGQVYALSGTPCGEVIGCKGHCCFGAGVQQRFPDDVDLVQLGAEAYVGEPIFDIVSGDPRGLIVLVSRHSLEDSEAVSAGLRILAARVAGSLARREEARARSFLEEKYRQLFETMAQGVVYQNAAGEVLAANPAAERILGQTLAQMQEQSSLDPRWRMELEDGTPVAGVDHPTMQAIRENRVVGPVIRGVYRPDLDAHVWLSITATPVYYPGETQAREVYAIFEDISASRLEERRQRAVLESLPVGVVVADNESRRLVYANPVFLDMFGYRADELAALGPFDLHPAAEAEHVGREFGRMLRGESSLVTDLRTLRSDGSEFHAEVRGSRVQLDGRASTLAVFTDVSARLAAEAAMRRQVALRELILGLSLDFIHLPIDAIDASTEAALGRIASFFDADRAYVFQYDLAAGTTTNTHEWCAPGIAAEKHLFQARPVEPIRDWIIQHQRGEAVIVADTAALPEGELRDVFIRQGIRSLVTVPILDGTTCLGFVGFDAVRERRSYASDELALLRLFAALLANLYKRRETESALRASEERFQLAVEGSEEGIWDMDLVHDRMYHSPRMHEMLGYRRDELPADFSAWMAIMHPDDLAVLMPQLKAYLEGRSANYEQVFRLRHKNGEWRTILSRGRALRGADGTPVRFTGTHRDVTELEQARRSLQQLNNIVEHSPVVAIAWRNGPDWPVEYVSENISAFGYTRDDFYSGRLEYGALVHPDDRAVFDAEIAGYFAHGPDEYVQVYRLRHGQGHWIWVEDHTWLTRKRDGQVATIHGVLMDVSLRKQAEAELEHHRRHLEDVVAARTAELVAAKLAAEAANRAKSVFLANMSHELRTPLNAILGFAQLMARDTRIPEDQQHSLAILNKSGQHLLALINDVLEISRIEAGGLVVSPVEFDLDEVLSTLFEVMRPRARDKGLALILDNAPGVPGHVEADLGKLRQILLNLLSNAVKYTERGEVVFGARPLADAGDRVELEFSVRDTGIGIAAADIERIFTPFYQTEAGVRLGEGTGLGLAISQEYARLLGGRLEVESTPGVGSCFRLVLSLHRVAAPAPVQPRGRVRGLSPGQPRYRVLVAEDEPSNREMLRRLLELVGFEVDTAVNGREAVARCAEAPPHMVLMDIHMPEMDGLAATRAICALPGGAGLPIVAFSALAFEEEQARMRAAGCSAVLSKPLQEEPLFELIEQCIGARFEREAVSGRECAGQPEVDASVLTAAVRQRLNQAAIALDGTAVRAIAAEISPAHPALAEHILTLAESYRFDLVAALCEAV